MTLSHSKSLFTLGVFLTGLTFSPAVSEGALIITIGNVSIPQGGTGSINVMIESDSALPVDALYAFNAEFVITPDGNSNELWFSDPQSQPELTDGSYVFSITGSAAIDSLPMPSGVVGPQTGYVVSDTSNDLDGATGPFTALLATLQFTTVGMPNAPQAGDQFTVALIPNLLLPDIYFINGNVDPIAFSVAPGGGTVTINAASAVPEPSSLLLATSALAGAGWFRARRRRANVTTTA